MNRNRHWQSAFRLRLLAFTCACAFVGGLGIWISAPVAIAQSAPPPAAPPQVPAPAPAPVKPPGGPKIGDILGEVINRTVQTPSGQAQTGQITPAGQTNPAPAPSDQGIAGIGAGIGSLFSASEADSGLRQALSLGAESVVARLGKVDGYFKDPKVKIPLPPRLAKIQSSLRPIGGLKALDDLQLRMNRAAETAAPQAKALFVDAIKGMSVTDALGIVRGPADGATTFMKGRTKDKLIAAFRPHVEKSLEGAGAFKAMDTATRQFGATGLAGNARAGLTDYAIGSALDGMFLYLAEEERAIRANPARQTTSLLKKVFGAK